MYTLTFTEPDGKPQSHPIADGQLLIGRDASCDVVLRSKDVSRRHARFFMKGGELLVEDLGSANGVYVRGARIEKAAPVAPGAAVEIGDVKVGQPVVVKTRAFPERPSEGRVIAIAPVAVKDEEAWRGKVFRVTTAIDNADLLLRPDMTGTAKIYCGQRRLLDVISRRLARYMRVEFWAWW